MEWVIFVKPSLYSKIQNPLASFIMLVKVMFHYGRYIINNLALYISNVRGTKENTNTWWTNFIKNWMFWRSFKKNKKQKHKKPHMHTILIYIHLIISHDSFQRQAVQHKKYFECFPV